MKNTKLHHFLQTTVRSSKTQCIFSLFIHRASQKYIYEQTKTVSDKQAFIILKYQGNYLERKND